ncbi:MAG: sensor histidine kinase [Verrucomicrobiae bacterium]|nr:sensor histidine kinase [Verrucomicrobiae bacterium]
MSAPSPSSTTVLPAPRLPWRAFRLVWIVGVIGVAVSLSLAVWFAREARRLDEARFMELAIAVGQQLDHRVEAIEGMLRDLARSLNTKPTPDLADWDEFMNQASPQWNLPGVLALGYATNVEAAATWSVVDLWARGETNRTRAGFYRLPEELMSSRSWNVWVLDCYRDDLRPPGSFAIELAVTNNNTGAVQRRRYREPATVLEKRDSPFLWQYYQGEMRSYADEAAERTLENAIFRDDVKIAGRQPLIRRADQRALPGAAMVVPTYHPRRTEFWQALSPSEGWPYDPFWLRWQLNAGFVFAYLDFAAMLKKPQGPGAQPLRVEIHAARTNGVSAASWLNPDGQPMRAGDSQFRPTFRLAYPWPMYGDGWTLFLHTTPLFDAQSTRYRAWWAGGWGSLTTGLVCWVLALQERGRLREARRAAQLQEARDALLAVQEQRERLSHDLHDGAIQSLYAIQLGLTQAAGEVRTAAPEASQRLGESRANLDAVIGELRQFLGRLRTPEAPRNHSNGLAAVLASTVRRLRPASRAAIELECDEALAARLSPDQALQLAGFAREALSNSLRHAKAKRIRVRLVAEATEVVLEVSDDGLGFDPAIESGKGFGLASLRRRTANLCGTLDLESAASRGTTVGVRFPGPQVTDDPAPDESRLSESDPSPFVLPERPET